MWTKTRKDKRELLNHGQNICWYHIVISFSFDFCPNPDCISCLYYNQEQRTCFNPSVFSHLCSFKHMFSVGTGLKTVFIGTVKVMSAANTKISASHLVPKNVKMFVSIFQVGCTVELFSS